MDFLSDYWAYHSCYEIPRSYCLFAGLGLLSQVVNRKVLYMHGDIEIHSMLYVGLIGPQGSSKSTCCKFARGFFETACPDAKIGPSRASPESIVVSMKDDDFARSYTNAKDEQIEIRPYAFFIEEFKNFVGRSPFDMITFLTDIYDVKSYDSSTIIRGGEHIINPAVSIIVCETPEWMVKNLKSDVLSGGFSRRMIYVLELEDTTPHPFIVIPPDVRIAEERFRKRLIDIRSVNGDYTWAPDARSVYEKWYNDNFIRRSRENIQTMRGYLRSKHVQLFKVMMLLDVVSDKPSFTFTKDLVDMSLALLDSIEANMPKLSLASGRNELAQSHQRILEVLKRNGGFITEKQLRRETEAEMNPVEQLSVLRHLEDTEQVIRKSFLVPNSEGKNIERVMVILPSMFDKLVKDGTLKVTSQRK